MKVINTKNIFKILILVAVFSTVPVMAYDTCGAFGTKTTAIIRTILNVVRIGAPILVVVLGALDFMKILISGEEKVYKEAGVTFLKRMGAVLVLIFVPYIIVFLLKISGALTEHSIQDSSIFCFFEF